MPRLLALDPGTVTVGLAVTDPTGALARPLAAIPRRPHGAFLERLASYLEEYGVEEIILGLPLETDGKKGKAAQRALSLAFELEKRLKLPVRAVDESYTTLEAEELLRGPLKKRAGDPGAKDKIAAALILERHLGLRRS
ncbi:MAG: Holliday junction resolvase RuvX [Deltaproteobacteria bacterium]|nr:Holliday junction resolvase RuvX [Deltaproteobacteria bacterium]